MSWLLPLSQVAGIAGFLLASASLWLGIKNYRHARSAPLRAEQMTIRNELRDEVFRVRADLQSSLAAWRQGHALPAALPVSIVELHANVPRYQRTLEGELKPIFKPLDELLVTVTSDWPKQIAELNKAAALPDPTGQIARIRIQTETSFSKLLESLVGTIDLIVVAINSENAK